MFIFLNSVQFFNQFGAQLCFFSLFLFKQGSGDACSDEHNITLCNPQPSECGDITCISSTKTSPPQKSVQNNSVCEKSLQSANFLSSAADVQLENEVKNVSLEQVASSSIQNTNDSSRIMSQLASQEQNSGALNRPTNQEQNSGALNQLTNKEQNSGAFNQLTNQEQKSDILKQTALQQQNASASKQPRRIQFTTLSLTKPSQQQK